ncbi:MAG: tetratricopeptide repeat protein [Xanthobacteraceae bacterium]|nr:tetratricopeptide repeat protein [Xanthobacteraceae bacterium]
MTSLIPAHGKLWYDDPWYRAAWLALPQAAALFVVGWAWLARPAAPGDVPWAKPGEQSEKRPAERKDEPPAQNPPQQKPYEAPPLAEQNLLAPCQRTDDWNAVVQACTLLLSSASTPANLMPEGYFQRAWAYRQVNQPQLALDDYNRAIALTPNDYRIFNDRGRLWRDVLKNNERAYEDFSRTIALKPDFAEAYASRGWLLIAANRPNDALGDMNSALIRDPKNTLAYEGRANIFEKLKSWRLMFEDAAKMIELMPNDRTGYEYRGHAFFENGQYQAAIADFTKAITIAPQEIYSYRLRGRSYYFLNEYDKAALDYSIAMRIVPNDSDTLGYIRDMQRRRR